MQSGPASFAVPLTEGGKLILLTDPTTGKIIDETSSGDHCRLNIVCRLKKGIKIYFHNGLLKSDVFYHKNTFWFV